jgi:hypothetical protein
MKQFLQGLVVGACLVSSAYLVAHLLRKQETLLIRIVPGAQQQHGQSMAVLKIDVKGVQS